MTDTILTLKQAEDAFQLLTLQLLGHDPSARINQGRVRISWPTNGSPSWKRDEDIVFIMLAYDNDPITQQQEMTYQNNDATSLNTELSYTRIIRIQWVFYGPNSSEDADKLRSSLYRPETTERLATNNLAAIFDSNSPMRSPELFNGQWWERSTYYARFNEKVVRRSSIPVLVSADVEILKG
jgi:hypothetical protein